VGCQGGSSRPGHRVGAALTTAAYARAVAPDPATPVRKARSDTALLLFTELGDTAGIADATCNLGQPRLAAG
jgi:hypothetical protein